MHTSAGFLALAISFLSLGLTKAATFDLVDDYVGQSFFEKWDFYDGWDNLTHGDVNYQTKEAATSKKLAEVNAAGNTILRVANNSVPRNGKRDSVRITTQKSYPLGTIWIADVVHLPFGCSVWPAMWTVGELWPDKGELDIVEGINLNSYNQMAVHTTEGCRHSASASQSGKVGVQECHTGSGCTVQEQDPRGYGDAFNKAGGGIWATEFTKERINIWFWSRDRIPESVKRLASSKESICSQDDWGTPSASYPAGSDCDISKFFGPQKFIINITLCGGWAKIPDLYQPQCGWRGSTSGAAACYNDNVVGDGSNYQDAYFEIRYLRAYVDPDASK